MLKPIKTSWVDNRANCDVIAMSACDLIASTTAQDLLPMFIRMRLHRNDLITYSHEMSPSPFWLCWIFSRLCSARLVSHRNPRSAESSIKPPFFVIEYEQQRPLGETDGEEASLGSTMPTRHEMRKKI